MGRVSVVSPSVESTSLAIANALLKVGLVSSIEKRAGSVGAESHLIVILPPEVGF